MDIDPVLYFKENDFTESLIWRIAYQSELNQIEFVLDYSGFVPAIARPLNDPTFQQPLDFRRLVFNNVTQLRRSHYLYKTGFRGFDPASFNLSAAGPALTVKIEAAFVGKVMDARRTTARYWAKIHMGSFGTYVFEFGSLIAFQRLVKIVSLRGGEVGHFDYYTSEKIDLEDPFVGDQITTNQNHVVNHTAIGRGRREPTTSWD